jgi:HlyD family secretion protein
VAETAAKTDAHVVRARRARRRSLIAWGVVVGSLVSFVMVAPKLFKKKPLSVRAVKVEVAAVRDVVSSSAAGEVVPLRHATVRAELGARVLQVKKQRGDRVKKGEAIVILDNADLEARIAQARATLAANTATMAQSEARVAAAQRAADRARTLAERGAGTTQISDDAEAALREAKEAVHVADGLRMQADAALRVAQVAHKKSQIDAPFDGLIIELHLDPGEELAPTAPVFEIIDDTKLHVEAAIDEADVARVRDGQPATLSLDALPGKIINGRVTKIGPAVRKDLKGARTMPIDVEVSDLKSATEAGLRSGMSANVEIIVAEKPNVLSLPTNVIIGRGAKRQVYRVDDGGIDQPKKAKLISVEIGLSNWDKSEVLSGVKAGDEIVATLNSKELEDGVPISAGTSPP